MLPVLTNRGNELLRLIADGLTKREISCYLTSSESTVEKRRISNRAQVVAHFYRLRTSSQSDTQIEGILHDRIGGKFHNIYGISTYINYDHFDYFHSSQECN